MLTGASGAQVKHTKIGNYYHKRKLFLTFYKGLIAVLAPPNFFKVAILTL